MVESLVDIAYKKLKRRENYEKRHSGGDYERKLLKPYKGKYINLQGDVRGVVPENGGYLVTLKNVIFKGQQLGHINFFLEEDSEFVLVAVGALQFASTVKVNAAVNSYGGKYRSSYGIKDVRSLEVIKKGVVTPVTSTLSSYLTGFVGGSFLKWKGLGSESLGISDLPTIKLLPKELYRYVESLLACGVRSHFSRSTREELSIFKQCHGKRHYTKSRIVQEALYFSGDFEYLDYLSRVRNLEEVKLGLDFEELYVLVNKQARIFRENLLYSGDWRDIPITKKRVNDSTGVPFAMKLKDEPRYVFIYPFIDESSCVLDSSSVMEQVMKDFNIPPWSQVLIYNPVLNRVAKFKSGDIK